MWLRRRRAAMADTAVILTAPPGQTARESIAAFAQRSVIRRRTHLLDKTATAMRHRLQRLVFVWAVADAPTGMGRRTGGGRTVAEMIRVIGLVVRPSRLSQKRHRNGK